MTKLKHEKGVVFDVPIKFQKMMDEMKEELLKNRITLLMPDELPDTVEDRPRQMNQRNGRYNRGGRYQNSNGYGRNNGFGRNSYGRDSGRDFGYQRQQRGNGFQRNDRGDRANRGEKDKKKLFIGNLSYNAVERDLEDLLTGKSHRPVDVYIVKD